ncbi:MAG TPA: holo-ACP synthase [Chthoniobacteraceae bacterium]|nr:holo-ACP synthase [Chthoniobacteraceae bacterium]
MLIGSGIDLVENDRIAGLLERHGERFLQRVFLPGEIAYCAKMREPAPHYAARFAAKEALSKAFGCGIGREIGFLDMEVIRADSGAPSFHLHGGAVGLAERRGVVRIFLSLSHTEQYAVAQALLVGRGEHLSGG